MKKALKVIGGIFVGFIVLVVAIAIFAPEEPDATKVNTSPTEQKDSTKEQPKIFKLGDVVKVKDPAGTGNIELTVDKQEFTKGDPYLKPKKGKVLKLYVTAVNHTGNSLYESTDSFNLYDKDGNKLENYFQDIQLYQGDINIGKRLSGYILFDVSGTEKQYELIYKPNTFLDTEIKWELKN